ncbi:MAG: Peptidoglycan O-acetyltransferase [Planctomycetes bacterium]|nr:Peptidoglycan O-acetyltransferase [Planctomycetota bacterium]
MVFNAWPFFVFLPVVFVLFWTIPQRLRTPLLAAASLWFYSSWDWRFLPLLLFSCVVDWAAGIGIEDAKTTRMRRVWIGVSLVTQLGMLAVFKYLDFGIESAARMLNALGFEVHWETLGIILPVGISFYTFQSLSYTLDVYRGSLRATRSLLRFTAFVAFFPQLVAGPIERASHLLDQFATPRTFDMALAKDGLRQMLWGLFLKTVIADQCAGAVDRAMAHPETTDGWQLLAGTWLFAFQIYGDFAGYSHIAIGCARLFGFELMRNFANPYFASSPVEFWRRWHISLSTWFRDYVYIPLGGNRSGPVRRRVNVFLTFLLSGIWHGAGAQFAVWGAFHGAFVALAPERKPDAGSSRPVLAAIRVLVMFQIVCVGWIFFRARGLGDAVATLHGIGRALAAPDLAGIRAAFLDEPRHVWALFAGIAVVCAIEWAQRAEPHPFRTLARRPTAVRWVIYLATALAVVVLGRMQSVPFIYFQF